MIRSNIGKQIASGVSAAGGVATVLGRTMGGDSSPEATPDAGNDLIKQSVDAYDINQNNEIVPTSVQRYMDMKGGLTNEQEQREDV